MTDQHTGPRQPTAPPEPPTAPPTTPPTAPPTAPALLDPSTPDPAPSPAPAPAPPPAKDRRVLRAVLRWTAAALVFAAVGTATAYGIADRERTDVPGLATEPDGRWAYPEITLPPLPAGSPAPFADGNAAGAHHADLRELVLPAPEGAVEDKALRGTDGWLATKELLAEYAEKEDREEIGQLLTDHALRHIAARGWTTQDGTRTRIYLLQFGTGAVADVVFDGLTGPRAPDHGLRGAPEVVLDEGFSPDAVVQDVTRTAYDEAKPYGGEHVRQAYLSAGDTIAVVVQSRKGDAKAVPFQQTVVLQSQLLG
ncbi:hypothetical protein [Streptomyces poonensis]|uniref:Uncharacterized protein n=1 Tax=Streptomyces poonensis TaxID=68255 RepID=A0A918PBE3_9ACTN|nr:hypothetical protein [Streptomyces poonensis]GGY96037.1 hypothetical protein GCM10010365_13680 [Streptomyces poonensis]GLJ88899.1 hypothetical protein GCM10017589_14990 [Streptomyces poonensis]